MSKPTAAITKKPVDPRSLASKQLFETVYVKPILDTIEKGAEWVMNMPEDRFDFEISVKDDKTNDIKVALFRKYLDKNGKPMLDPKTKAVVKPLKCSTYSANVGCIPAEDFRARSQLATQENTCSKQVPYPMKKIEG